MREEEKDYIELLNSHHTLQRQYRNAVQKHKSSIQLIKKLKCEIARLKLRLNAQPRELDRGECLQKSLLFYKGKGEKDDLLEILNRRLKDAEKQLDVLKLENRSKEDVNNNQNEDSQMLSQLQTHLHELKTQHELDTFRLNIQEGKLRKILTLHNEYKARHIALKEELHFHKAEIDQIEEYKDEVMDLREQNRFLEEQVTKLCDGGNHDHEEEKEALRYALCQKEAEYEMLLEEVFILQGEK